MTESPREPLPQREEVVERREVTERHTGPVRAEPGPRGPGTAWIWLVLLLFIVLGLVWYVLSRGQPQEMRLPEIEAPTIEVPQPEQRIEINVPARQEEPPADPGD